LPLGNKWHGGCIPKVDGRRRRWSVLKQGTSERILNCLKQSLLPLTTKRISEHTGIPVYTVRKYLREQILPQNRVIRIEDRPRNAPLYFLHSNLRNIHPLLQLVDGNTLARRLLKFLVRQGGNNSINSIRSSIKYSRSHLRKQLSQLCDLGLVQKAPAETGHHRHLYRLTRLGRSLLDLPPGEVEFLQTQVAQIC